MSQYMTSVLFRPFIWPIPVEWPLPTPPHGFTAFGLLSSYSSALMRSIFQFLPFAWGEFPKSGICPDTSFPNFSVQWWFLFYRTSLPEQTSLLILLANQFSRLWNHHLPFLASICQVKKTDPQHYGSKSLLTSGNVCRHPYFCLPLGVQPNLGKFSHNFLKIWLRNLYF